MSQEMYAQQAFMTTGPEAALLQYAGTQNGLPIDPVLQQHIAAQQMQASMEQYQPRPYTPQDGQYMMQDPGFAQMQFTHALAPGVEPEDRRRKNSAATATNDKELRELLSRNETRALKEVAQEVIQKERTPQAEKTKQLFAMLWLRKVCKPAKTSVPRNRVYSHYATRCGTERVVPLNPASFGKLVRVIFPGIQTRRLGVRGESKYHYVDLALCDEEEPQQQSNHTIGIDAQQDFRRSASAGIAGDFASGPRFNVDTAAFPVTDASLEVEPSPVPDNRGPPSQGRLFAYPDSRGMKRDHDTSLMYDQTLRFPARLIGDIEGDDSIALPNIHPYCPPKTDTDTADALVALYRTHCTSLIDCIRFCKEKQFFRLFTSFHGTLTVPVQKLFSHPNLASWIQECDYLMYQKMVRFVSRLTLQAAPPVVITILNNISTNLHAHISKTFSAHPLHVLQAKLKPAATFASLLHRLIRVNAAAHAAANLLTVDQNREQMWREWVTMVNPKRVMEGELPDCGYDEVYKILTCDIRSLLEPLQAPPFPDNPMFSFDNQAYSINQGSFGPTSVASATNEQGDSISTENVLDRWAAFLGTLPTRFPQADTRTLLHCISSVGTAALRDITIMGGASYQTWWVMKIFVDEMSLWLAAMGGFLERVSTDSKSTAMPTKTPSAMNNGEMRRSNSSRSASASRMSSIDGDMSQMQNAQAGHSEQLGNHRTQQLSRTHSMHSIHSNHDLSQSFDGSINGSQISQSTARQPLSRQNSYHQPHQQVQQIPQKIQQTPRLNEQSLQQQQAFQSPPPFNFDISPIKDNQGQYRSPQNMTQQKGDIDDSGICMNFNDDEDVFAKFGITTGHGHDFVGGELGVNAM
ncbi:Protein sak1 [Sphaceloma murrayae]|uniref:Protein sak1 n=1 Tax=Sphaceloma murrayae TaxID=2082308 RepID=A0A2K1QJN6_9PEZI|nr:Protein sak1 [Sphaceloma murrayae]